MTKKIFEGDFEPIYEDGRQALYGDVVTDDVSDEGMFVRLQSWDEEKEHEALKLFAGKRVRVTVETLDS